MTRSTFLLPALIALATLAGLFCALLGDGAADALSALGLLAPIAAVAWAMRCQRC